MGTGWFGAPAGGGKPGVTLSRLVEAVSRMLDGLGLPAMTPGSGLVDAAASAVVLPSASVPGCGLVVQVAEWSSSVGCWWTVGDDPGTGPLAGELFAEFPLRPDGVDRAVAWLEGELRRPVVSREHRYGVATRRRWSLVLDDGSELPVRGRWLPPWSTAGAGGGPLPAARLLGAAVAAAAAGWVLAAATPGLFWAPWTWGAVWLVNLAAFALLLAWFGVAGLDQVARVRLPMLAGLGLATLGEAVALLPGPAQVPSPDDPAGQAALSLRGLLPSLLGAAALACWLAAVLGLPGRRRLPVWLPVAAGVGWTLDVVVGLGWLLAAARDHPDELLAWYGAPTVALREATLAVAVLLLLAAADRRPAGAVAGAGPGLAGAALLVVASSFTVQAGLSALVGWGPQLLGAAAVATVPLAAGFAGAALVAVALARPAAQPPTGDDASPRASEVTASPRNPTARPNWDE
jgi:hypothetical protein